MQRTVHPISAGSLRDHLVRGFDRFAARPALIHEKRVMSFAEVERRVTQIGRMLVAAGVGEKPLVAVCCERGFDLYASILAPVLLGGAYLPLSAEEPESRLASMVARARPAAVITTAALASRFSGLDAPVVVVDEAESDDRPAGLAAPPVSSSDPAYVIFTSGSTGQPKGAVIPNRAIVNRLEWMARALGIDADDVLIQKTPVTFDVSVWEVFLPYLTGAALVIPRHGGHRDVSYISRLVGEHLVTVIHFVPSAFAHYLQHAGLEADARSLRAIVTSGEALPVELRDRCLYHIPGASLYNLYGPTEAAVDVTCWKCARDDPYETVPIGRAIDNVDLYVVDEDRRPVAPGVRGELCIGEVAVGSGYLNDPERTADSFVQDTICGVPDRRMYRTGDIVVCDPDGVIEFVGRRDFQVKIRGNRVELGEVESALRATGTVRDAVAMTATDAHGQTILRAYVVPPDPARFDELGCLKALRRLVPDPMIPSELVTLKELPLTAHGKVDRARLPAPERERAAGAGLREHDVPDAMTALRRIWCEVLGRADVDPDVNFFDLGGTSLSILRIPAMIEERLGRRIELVDLFDRPTIRDVAELLTES